LDGKKNLSKAKAKRDNDEDCIELLAVNHHISRIIHTFATAYF